MNILSRVVPALLVCLLAAAPVRADGITDSDGNRIDIGSGFGRIISLYVAHTQNLVSMGAEEKIIAVSGSDTTLQRPRLRYRDDAERFLALGPDLVLIRPMISRAHPQLVKRLRHAGVTVVSLQPVSIGGMFDYWKTLGQLCGRQEAAADMVRRFRSAVAAMEKKVEEIPVAARKRVYFESIHRRMKTFAPGSMAIFVLTAAGGINIAADALQLRNTNIAEYGKERILARAEEIDVFLAQKGRMNPVSRREIISEPGFQVIRAVRNGRVYLIDEKLVSRPTMGLLTGIRRLFGILYPER